MGWFRRVSDILTSPTGRLVGPVERGTARLLSVCLLGLFVAFSGLDLALVLTLPDYTPPWQGYLFLGVSYALSRTHRYRVGAILTTVMFPTVAVSMVIQGRVDGLGPLSYSLLAPFFAGLFLGVRAALVFAFLSPTAIALLPLVSNVSFFDVINHFISSTVGGMVAVSYAMHRDWVEKRRRESSQIQEAQLIQMQKMEALGRMAGGIAHDFNNLLTVISGGIEILARNGAGKELRLIESATQSAQTLTTQLLTLSRQRVVEHGSSDVAQALEGAQRLLSRIIGEDIQVKVSVAPGTHPVVLSESQLQQVILNLATNARDAMPEGGSLVLRAENEGDRLVKLVVRDTGVGMDWETREKLFEPFFTTKSVGKGTGLGLSIVFGILTQAGGSIEVESEPGHGATFTLYLPRSKQASQSPEANDPPLALDGRARGKVLLVEDDAGVRELCRSVLRREGYEVIEAADPEEALQFFSEEGQRVDLLITDIVMPKMSGLVLAETLRLRAPDLPVLFISGYAPEHLAGRPVQTRHILQKPFRPTQLLRRVSSVLYGLDSLPPPRDLLPSEGEVIPPTPALPFSGTESSPFPGEEDGSMAPDKLEENSALRERTKALPANLGEASSTTQVDPRKNTGK